MGKQTLDRGILRTKARASDSRRSNAVTLVLFNLLTEADSCAVYSETGIPVGLKRTKLIIISFTISIPESHQLEETNKTLCTRTDMFSRLNRDWFNHRASKIGNPAKHCGE